MTKSRKELYPGWKMTYDQHSAYFWHLGKVYEAQGCRTAAEKEDMRKFVHLKAFGSVISAKAIDKMKMFDDFKAACLALTQPANLEAQLDQANMPLTRLKHGILNKFDEDFILSILCSARFKKNSLADLDGMSETELTQLRDTLCARSAGWCPVGTFNNAETAPVQASEPVKEVDGVLMPF